MDLNHVHKKNRPTYSLSEKLQVDVHTLTLLTDQCIIQTDRDHDPILLNVWNAISRLSDTLY